MTEPFGWGLLPEDAPLLLGPGPLPSVLLPDRVERSGSAGSAELTAGRLEFDHLERDDPAFDDLGLDDLRFDALGTDGYDRADLERDDLWSDDLEPDDLEPDEIEPDEYPNRLTAVKLPPAGTAARAVDPPAEPQASPTSPGSGSYSERYRDTPWSAAAQSGEAPHAGQAPQAAPIPQSAPPQPLAPVGPAHVEGGLSWAGPRTAGHGGIHVRRSRASLPLVAVGLVVALAAGGMAVFGTAGSAPADHPAQLPDARPLAYRTPVATRVPTPLASLATLPAAGSQAPVPAVVDPVGGPRPTPYPLGTALVPLRGRVAVVGAMETALRDPAQTSHLELVGSIKAVGVNVGLDGSFDIAGPDMRGSLMARGSGGTVSLGMVLLDQVLYIQVDGGDWVSQPVPAGTSTGFGEIRARDLAQLRYEGVERLAGKRLHRFRLADRAWKGLSRLLPTGGQASIRDLAVDVLVDDGGRVVSEHLAAHMIVRKDGESLTMTMVIELRYSRFGERVEIGRPNGTSAVS